jgi:hypothetical protein
MTYATKLKFLIISVIAFYILSRIGCYYINKKYDTVRRPWAYATDKPLLVGKWKGQCMDPDKDVYDIDLEIFKPMSEDKRWARVMQKRIKRDRSSTTFFNGIAIATHRGVLDTFEIWGGLDKADGDEMHFQFRPLDDHHPEGFNLNLAKGKWQKDNMNLSVSFAYFTKEGYSHYESDNPKHEQLGLLKLSRNEITN